MKLLSVRQEPHFLVRFKPAELKLLQKSSDAHYDAKCRSLNECGGMIYGMAIWRGADPSGPIERELTWREIDTLRKVLEVGVHLHGKREAAVKLSRELYQLLTDGAGK